MNNLEFSLLLLDNFSEGEYFFLEILWDITIIWFFNCIVLLIDILHDIILPDEPNFGEAYFDWASVLHEKNKFNKILSVLNKADKIEGGRSYLP